MTDVPAMIVRNVSKSFKLPHEKHGSIKSLFINGFRRRRSYERQEVLKDISLEIKEGEFFGIIGRNGNGKSTLLKLLAGIYSPDEGVIEINGKLTPFIELGVGFNPELTGRDNVYLNGALLGLNRKEVEAIYDEVVAFAELEKFMDQKLKNYSSGMQVRLAFSIAIRAKTDILLIDEVLAVGDTNFQKKCIEVFEDLKREGRTIVFVSHSMGYIRDFCDRVAVINAGKLAFVGDTEKAVDLYNKLNEEDESNRIDESNKSNQGTDRLGNGKATITSYHFYNDKGEKTTKLAAGKKFSAEVNIEFNDTVQNPAIGIMFRKNPSENLLGISNYYNNQNAGIKKKGDRVTLKAEGKMPLATGTYFVSFSVSDAESESKYSELDILNNTTKVQVTGKTYWGMLSTEIKTELL